MGVYCMDARVGLLDHKKNKFGSVGDVVLQSNVIPCSTRFMVDE